MVWRLDPDLPVLWRSPSSLQVGTDPRLAVVDDLPRGAERLVAALAAGVSVGGWDLAVASAGVAPTDAARVRDALTPALVPDSAAGSPSAGRAARARVYGESTLARSIAGLLATSGALAPEAAPPDLVVLVGDWVLAPADSARFLRRDIPHLPVLVTERAVSIGPVVEPGRGPCLHCIDLARRDDDPAWPALAAQLLGRPPRDVPRLEAAEATALAARVILSRLASGSTDVDDAGASAWRLDRDGSVSERRWRRHPECRCAAPPGSDWADAPPAPLGAPTRGSGDVGPA